MNVPTSTSTPIRKDIDAATLHRLYHEEDMTIKGIAELCGICPATVRKYLGPVGKRRAAMEAVDPNALVKATLYRHQIEAIHFAGRLFRLAAGGDAQSSISSRGVALLMEM